MPSNSLEGRNLRIRLLAEILHITVRGLDVSYVRHSNTFDAVHDSMTKCLVALDDFLRIILPLSGKYRFQ